MNNKILWPITILASLITVMAMVSVTAAEQTTEEKIERAMQAAPEVIGQNATIMEADGTILRQGTNGWTCLPSAGPGSTHPMCNDDVWMSLVGALGKKADFKTERIGFSYMLAGDDNVNNADPFDTQQDPGEVWVQEGPHLMIIVPNAKMIEGISDDPTNGGPYIMWKDTPYIHLMVPVAPAM
jgi:hypothetical protein